MSDLPDEIAENPAPTFAAVGLKNWAMDARVRERLKFELLPLMGEIRRRKQPLNQMWASLFKVWSLEHERQSYIGDASIYVPAGKKGVETLTSQLVNSTFPGDDVFSVEPRSDDWRDMVPDVKAVQAYNIEYAKTRAYAEKFYRLLTITGNAPTKFSWHKKVIRQKGRVKSKSKKEIKMFGPSMPATTDLTLYDGPKFEVVDPSNLYIYPETVDQPCDALLVFEDMTVSLSSLRMKTKGDLPIYVPDEVEALARGEITEKRRAADDKGAAQGFVGPATEQGAYGLTDISEVYFDFDPLAKDYKTEVNPVPFLVTVAASGQILRAIENPWWHKRAPYALGRMGTQTGRVWGTGYVEAIRELQLLLNDQTNQMLDCATYHLNPFVLVNPEMVYGDLPELEPGVQLLVRDLAALKFDRPPGDLIQSGSILTTQTTSWINDFIGAPPVLQGGSSPGRAFKTATGIGTAQRNAALPLQEVVKLAEAEVWEPMLGFYWSLTQQFGSEAIFAGVGGGMKRIRPTDLYGDYMYRWLASSQAQNQTVKGGQINDLLALLSGGPLTQLLQANGVRVNPVPLLRRLYQEVLGFRDVDEVLVQQAAQAAGMGGPPPGRPPELGATNPLAGQPGTEPSPEFDATREEANLIAGMTGGSNQEGMDDEMM